MIKICMECGNSDGFHQPGCQWHRDECKDNLIVSMQESITSLECALADMTEAADNYLARAERAESILMMYRA